MTKTTAEDSRIDFAELASALRTDDSALHPDTAPEVIRVTQMTDVLIYLHRHPGATVEEIAAAVVLPVWSVQCRLAEHRGEPLPFCARPSPQTRNSDGTGRRIA